MAQWTLCKHWVGSEDTTHSMCSIDGACAISTATILRSLLVIDKPRGTHRWLGRVSRHGSSTSLVIHFIHGIDSIHDGFLVICRLDRSFARREYSNTDFYHWVANALSLKIFFSSSPTLVIVFESYSTVPFVAAAAAYLSCCVPSIRLSVCVVFSFFLSVERW